MAQTNDGILYAIRFRETGEEKVARQLARLDQALNLLRGGTAKGYYNSSVFSKKWKDRLHGKGSGNFRKQIRKLMLDVAVDICVDLITMSKGTTGNAAFSWQVSLVYSNIVSGAKHNGYTTRTNTGLFYKRPKLYLNHLREDSRNSGEYNRLKSQAISRENQKRSDADLQPLAKNGYTIYISNYAFIAPEGTLVRNFAFSGYYARMLFNTPSLGKYGVHDLSSAQMDEYVQKRYKELFNAGLKRIK